MLGGRKLVLQTSLGTEQYRLKYTITFHQVMCDKGTYYLSLDLFLPFFFLNTEKRLPVFTTEKCHVSHNMVVSCLTTHLQKMTIFYSNHSNLMSSFTMKNCYKTRGCMGFFFYKTQDILVWLTAAIYLHL